jgi:Fe-S-cluster formation regulator IscX/YfhJ
MNELYRRFAAQHPDTVKIVNLARIVCPAGPPCPQRIDGVRLRPRDGRHFHDDGPAWVSERVLDAVLEAFGAAPTVEKAAS